VTRKKVALLLLSAGMVAVGISHFVAPAPFVAIVPRWLPSPELLVYVSGACEVAGGLGLLHPRTRVPAAWGLFALYLAVFPANVNMAIHGISPTGTPVPAWAAWGRLPFQLVFLAWAWWLTRPEGYERAG
jgi:uncharacterized membrane protein